MQNSRIDGAGIFFILRDESSKQVYTILSRSNRKSGSYLQDLGGFLQSGKSFKQSATQETFEESCGTLFVNPDALDHYLIINGKYMSFFCVCELNVQKFFNDLRDLYMVNRSYIFQQQQRSGDYHIKCFLETNQLELILLSNLSDTINKTHKGKLALYQLDGVQLEIHRRTQSIIQQLGQTVKMIQSQFTWRDLIVSVNQTKTKILWGRKAIFMTKKQTIEQNVSPVTQHEECSAQINIFLKDKKDIYMLIPVGQQYKIVQNCQGKSIEEQLKFACEQTAKHTYMSVIVQPQSVQTVMIEGRILFSVMTEVENFVKFASYYAENQRESQEIYFDHYEVFNLEEIKQMCQKRHYQIHKQEVNYPIDSNTVTDLQYYYKKGFSFLYDHKLSEMGTLKQEVVEEGPKCLVFGKL